MRKLILWVTLALLQTFKVKIACKICFAKFVVDHPDVIVSFGELRTEELTITDSVIVTAHTLLEVLQGEARVSFILQVK